MKILLLGERSNRLPDEGSAEQILESPTRSRLDALYPRWETACEVRNVWKNKTDDAEGKTRVLEILSEVQPTHIITLGITVSLLLDTPYPTPWLSTTPLPSSLYSSYTINSSPTPPSVLKFPHPSPRARVWNDSEFSEQAQNAFTEFCETGIVSIPEKSEKPNESKKEKVSREAPTPLEFSGPSAGKKTGNPCEVTEKYLKVSKEYIATCDCGWAVAAPRQNQRDGEVQFHLERMKSKPRNKKARQ